MGAPVIVAQAGGRREERTTGRFLRYITGMALNRELVDLLACPKCKGALALRPDESAFECPACKLAYAVTDDIPNFLIEEAQRLA
jgi:hypothetical protein